LRVLVVTNLYPPHALGGYEMSCHDVMTRFSARGHDVCVLTTATRVPGVDDVPEPQVHRDLCWYWDDHRIVQPGMPVRLRIERHNRARLSNEIKEFRPDVVSMWAMGAMSLGLIDVVNEVGKPAVYVVCDEWPVYGPRLDAWTAWFARRRGRLLAPVVRAATRLPTALVEPRNATYCWLTDFVRRQVLDATGWQPQHETVTYSGIDPMDFPVTPADDRPWRWRLLCVGRVEPRKGFAAAVEALPLLPPQTTLRIVGPDDRRHREELATLATRLGVADRLDFATVPRSQLGQVYADADVLLFTSAWEEPFGLVPIEAMACATPVVAAATGGSREYLVDGGNSLVVPPGDPAALAAAVERLAADEALRARLRAGGNSVAERLTVDRLTDVLEEWHARAAGRGAA
jgi:glycogen(starch) synthase